MVQEIVEHCSLGWKLNVFELCHPPFCEFNTVIHKLHNRGVERGSEGEESEGEGSEGEEVMGSEVRDSKGREKGGKGQ